MADELDDEERELIRAHRESKRSNDDDDQVSLTLPNGANLTGTFRRISEFAAAHGLKLIPDPPADDDKPAGKGNVKRFQTGRRVS